MTHLSMDRAAVITIHNNTLEPVTTILTDVCVDPMGVSGVIEIPEDDAGHVVFYPMHRILTVFEDPDVAELKRRLGES